MLIFRFEWKRKRKYILIWAATLAVCIFSMTPVYYGMIETVELIHGTICSGICSCCLGLRCWHTGKS